MSLEQDNIASLDAHWGQSLQDAADAYYEAHGESEIELNRYYTAFSHEAWESARQEVTDYLRDKIESDAHNLVFIIATKEVVIYLLSMGVNKISLYSSANDKKFIGFLENQSDVDKYFD